MRFPFILLAASALFAGMLSAQTAHPTGDGWPTYGGDPGGQRYSSSNQITRANVSGLRQVWEYHTHALESGSLAVSRFDFEATPILFSGTLYLDTPYDRVIALDPETGAERWTYDPKLPKDTEATNYTSRGVTAWQSGAPVAGAACNSRIYVTTLNAKLIALDAVNGKPCTDFGKSGSVDLHEGISTDPRQKYRFYGDTSPATVVGDVVVVGSAVADNQTVQAESGAVRGFDARTGKQLWSWEPLLWAQGRHPRTGAGNAWSVIAADPEHNLVYIPTGAPSPDFYGGFRPGDNRDANSLVALDARTGKKVWAFQTVHHDVWDYDIAAEPLLFDYQGKIPAVAVAPKTGVVFIFNRLTGEPLSPITERPVPPSDVPGEVLSPTQPFSALPALGPTTMDLHDLPGHSPEDTKTCSTKLASLRYDGIFTPPSLRGSLQYPGSIGGVNWGGMSLDPTTGILYSNVNGSAYEIKLVPQLTRTRALLQNRRAWILLALFILIIAMFLRRRLNPGLPAFVLVVLCGAATVFFLPPARFHFKRDHNMVNSPDSVGEISPDDGAPYRIFRRVLQDKLQRPCTPQPWGMTAALNLNTGKMEWRKPLGTMIEGQHTGTVSLGAPVVTAGGLLFTAATSQPLLRAIDKTTGEEVWTGPLPVPAQSTPMTYTLHGRQYIVVSAGGHGGLGTKLGDSVVAFALP
jgi:quinoprotein glucose dehydrogenase